MDFPIDVDIGGPPIRKRALLEDQFRRRIDQIPDIRQLSGSNICDQICDIDQAQFSGDILDPLRKRLFPDEKVIIVLLLYKHIIRLSSCDSPADSMSLKEMNELGHSPVEFRRNHLIDLDTLIQRPCQSLVFHHRNLMVFRHLANFQGDNVLAFCQYAEEPRLPRGHSAERRHNGWDSQ